VKSWQSTCMADILGECPPTSSKGGCPSQTALAGSSLRIHEAE
jgi:hypothetical protein